MAKVVKDFIKKTTKEAGEMTQWFKSALAKDSGFVSTAGPSQPFVTPVPGYLMLSGFYGHLYACVTHKFMYTHMHNINKSIYPLKEK